MTLKKQSPRLQDLPLWRLLVALADAERAFGVDHATTLAIASAVKERLREIDAPRLEEVRRE
jgi:hypothetical protein